MPAQCIADIASITRTLSGLAEMPRDQTTYHRVTAAVHTLCVVLHEAESAGVCRDEVSHALKDAWDLHGRSHFIRRLQSWPRGYLGDFETIDYLMGGVNQSPVDTIGYHLESLALSSPISQQHRNKMYAQADQVRRIVAQAEADGVGRRILSIACGSSPDLGLLGGRIADSKCHFVITDGDPGAIEAAVRKLGPLPNVEAVCGNIFRKLGVLARKGPFDLVTAGGLYDYLPADAARALTSRILRDLVKPGGRLFFTNIAIGNPFRIWIENLARWRVIERSQADILALVGDPDEPGAVSIERETTGLTWMVAVDRAAAPAGGLRSLS